jgi:hypothetical protein
MVRSMHTFFIPPIRPLASVVDEAYTLPCNDYYDIQHTFSVQPAHGTKACDTDDASYLCNDKCRERSQMRSTDEEVCSGKDTRPFACFAAITKC